VVGGVIVTEHRLTRADVLVAIELFHWATVDNIDQFAKLQPRAIGKVKDAVHHAARAAERRIGDFGIFGATMGNYTFNDIKILLNIPPKLFLFLKEKV